MPNENPLATVDHDFVAKFAHATVLAFAKLAMKKAIVEEVQAGNKDVDAITGIAIADVQSAIEPFASAFNSEQWSSTRSSLQTILEEELPSVVRDIMSLR